MNGLIGLTGGTQDRESKIRDLSVLERMSQNIESDKVAEIQAQQQEQMFYDKMYQTADQMLDKDRKKINQKIVLAQKTIREHLSQTGGSRKDFMAQGGINVLGDIQNGIIQSDEANQYKENKKNLAKILEIKEKGFGHLLAPRDIEAMEAYQNNEDGGPISYSGMMTEVEIPPSANFDYGTEIPINNILSYNSNLMKIMGNYKIQNPDAPELDPQKNPEDYVKLVAFAKKMGYGGQGSNTTMLRQKMIADQEKAAYDKKTSTNKKDEGTISYLNELNVLKSKIPAGLTVADINGKYEGNLIDNLRKSDPTIGKLLGNKFQPKAYKRSLSEEGFDITDIGLNMVPGGFAETLFKDKVGLKESYAVMEGNEAMFADAIFGKEGLGFKLEGGSVIDFTPTEDMYRMDGVKLTGDNKLDPADHKGNFKVVGVTTALKSKMASDGNDALLINAYDNDGELDKENTEKIDKGYTSEAGMTTVVALEDKDGNLFYKEIDLSKPHIKTKMSAILGKYDDLTDTVKQENVSAQAIAQISANTKEEQILFEGTKNQLEQKVFKDPMFKAEGENFFGENSGGQENRYNEMKAFYMAFDYLNNSYRRDEQNPQGDKNIYPETVQKAIDNELFTSAMITGGVEEEFKNYAQGNDPQALIGKWLTNMNQDLQEGSLSYKKNQELASKWMQILGRM